MASNQENSSKVLILHLQSSDGVVFDVELAIAKRSMMIRTMIESLGEDSLDEVLPLTKIKSDTLKKVIEFATHHKNDPMPKEYGTDERTRMTEWDRTFLEVDLGTLFSLARAANYLDMKDLLDLVTQAIGQGYFKDKSMDELKKTFEILMPK
ncbi:S-phase kinase-associated protein 1-like [Trichogramma pretiosum]|uniref:S-phase kinase-associated protein 1-like n=1 Tax=Trichogramma pretiosum TaxID=7493 RepID=UPI0006C9CB75|nr:S-phase kinase-associated protein 1-like [Trichogramma pretiosum]